MVPMSNDYLLGTEFWLRNNCGQGSIPSVNYVQDCEDVHCSEDIVFGINLSHFASSNLEFSSLSFKNFITTEGNKFVDIILYR
jgi:hypothetical protein